MADEPTCKYCELPAFEPDIIRPNMCEAHYNIALCISHLQKMGKPVDVPHLLDALEDHADTLDYDPDEVPMLYAQMVHGDHSGWVVKLE